MNKMLLMLLLAFLVVSCKSKKTVLADEDEVEIEGFIDFFPDVQLPYEMTDSLINRKPTDSSTIGYKIFTQFVPDSVLSGEFGSKTRPQIYPLGKSVVEDYETYLFIKAVSPAKKAGYIVAFDKDNKFVSAMPLIVPDKNPATIQSATLDKKYSLTSIKKTKNSEGLYDEQKNVYILNADARVFTLILTDAGIPDEEQEIINPIDTFPKKNKFSGDYVKDKRNYVSIRDGRNSNELLFFTHFEKNKGECTGELKGTATINGAKTALYRANGNPCVLEFSFQGNAVAMREVEACGSYRDITCFFDGSYQKKKEPKQKKATARK
jgi:hypothetical protein